MILQVSVVFVRYAIRYAVVPDDLLYVVPVPAPPHMFVLGFIRVFTIRSVAFGL